jgi:hypothetical protein
MLDKQKSEFKTRNPVWQGNGTQHQLQADMQPIWFQTPLLSIKSHFSFDPSLCFFMSIMFLSPISTALQTTCPLWNNLKWWMHGNPPFSASCLSIFSPWLPFASVPFFFDIRSSKALTTSTIATRPQLYITHKGCLEWFIGEKHRETPEFFSCTHF